MLSFLLQLKQSFFKDTSYGVVTFKDEKVKQKEVTFSFCVKVNSNGRVEYDTDTQLKNLLNATEVKVEITGTSP